jgi:TonB-dependent receptor-like protein
MPVIAQVLLAVSIPFTIVAQQPADSVPRDTALAASARPSWDDQEEYRTGTRFSDVLVVRAERAGLRVSPAAGTLGLTGRVRFRGVQTFSDDRLPLVILDGVRLDVASGFLGGTSRLEDINPDDILSIEVLSPAQGVRYGPNAANGVLIVRTRQGAKGKPEWRGYVDVGTRTPVDHWPIRMGGFDASSPDSSFRHGGCTLVAAVTNQCTQDSIAVLSSPLTRQFRTAIRRQYGLSVAGGWAKNRYYVAGESDGDGSPFALSADEVNRLQSIGQTVPRTVRHPQHVGNGNLTANLRLRPVAAISVDLHGLHVSQDLRAPAFANETANTFGVYALQAGWIAPGDAFQVQTVSNMSRWLGGVDVAWTPIQSLTVTGSLGHDGVRFATDLHGSPAAPVSSRKRWSSIARRAAWRPIWIGDRGASSYGRTWD